MLKSLYISNIVLIERAELNLAAGLVVLTGETGAGKSMVLDALALALGARSDAGLVRHGENSATVVAEFEIRNTKHETRNILSENGIDAGDELVLRRTLSADGKSRAWINDTPVSLKILKTVGDALVEIHGQFENHSLLDSATHITALDEFGGYDLSPVRSAYSAMRAADGALAELKNTIARAAETREFLQHQCRELSALNPGPDEEDELAGARAAYMDAEKNAGILSDAAAELSGLDKKIFSAAHILERIKTDPNPYAGAIEKLYELGDEISQISERVRPAEFESVNIESIEERLFALRAAARKHRVTVAELPDVLSRMESELAALDAGDINLKKLEQAALDAKNEYEKIANELHEKRVNSAAKMRDAIMRELPDLKLGSADFMIEITSGTPTAIGTDNVGFMIKTNPGTPFAQLDKIASGGELARFMLALRVALSGGNTGRVFVFDEVDTGISGATAAAVGVRLARLAECGQAVVITHSAQVAGHANQHLLIKKETDGNRTTTSVCDISGDARVSEIARIISGANITPDSLAAAKELIKCA